MEKIVRNINIIKEEISKISSYINKVEEDFASTSQAMSPTPIVLAGKPVEPKQAGKTPEEDKEIEREYEA